MALLLALILLQAPDDLGKFLADLEKERAKGAPPAELLKKLELWSQGRPPDTLARLAWNRALLETTVRIDTLFLEGLQRRVGKPVSLGRNSGTIREVKKDRLILIVPGGQIEVEFSSIPPDVRIDDLKKEKLLPEKSFEEAVFRFSGSRTPAAMSFARALTDDSEKARALAAVAGCVLQAADRTLAAGGPVKTAEELAATWSKHADLVEAADGAVRNFLDTVLGPKLVAEADAVLAKDRKAARRILEMAAGLCRSPEIAKEISDRRWSVLEKGEWMKLPLESLAKKGGTLDGTKLAWQDDNPGMESAESIDFDALPVPWDQISGIRAKVRPGTATHVDMRLGFGVPARYHSAVFQAKEPLVFYSYMAGRQEPGKASPGKSIAKKPEYELRAEGAGSRWRFSVDATELQVVELDDAPSQLLFVINDGRSELISLDVRKK
ncbi:MAG TPA: hypothetical protein VGK61_04740 [Planctomycetota bacterium]